MGIFGHTRSQLLFSGWYLRQQSGRWGIVQKVVKGKVEAIFMFQIRNDGRLTKRNGVGSGWTQETFLR